VIWRGIHRAPGSLDDGDKRLVNRDGVIREAQWGPTVLAQLAKSQVGWRVIVGEDELYRVSGDPQSVIRANESARRRKHR